MERKCNLCGLPPDDEQHDLTPGPLPPDAPTAHAFEENRDDRIVEVMAQFICNEVGVDSSSLIDVQAREMLEFMRDHDIAVRSTYVGT